MIELRRGDILKAKTDVLVNTVNCVGVMGRGIALQFKKAFPDMFRAYAVACERGDVVPGKVQVHDLNRLEAPHYVINFPTKKHWRGKSRMEDVELGLKALIVELRRLDVSSVAVPPLGCGLGGLDWNDVRPRIEQAFGELPEVQVLLYEPKGAPTAAEMAKEEKTPNMTEGRALLLVLMRRYLAAVMDPTVSLLEIHKLMYFMQEAGQPLRLTFSKGSYGPYGENLRHVLTHIEGHFVLGYGDAADKPEKPIEPMREAMIAAEDFIGHAKHAKLRLDRVAELIEGFETSFGMELLSTVHWLAVHESVSSPEEAAQRAYAWNSRKRMFSKDHIRLAWSVLEREGWLPERA